MTPKQRTGAAVALCGIVLLVYYPALSASFFDDDYQWLVGSWSFQLSQLIAFGTMTHFYRPVIDLYFATLTPLFGGSPVLFHAASIALHAANVLVVFALARRIWKTTAPSSSAELYAFTAALFFAVQPSHIDAIAWVGALAEAVGALFGCLSLFFFLDWPTTGRPRRRTRSIGMYALALLTHESSVVFLPTLALAHWLLGRAREDEADGTARRDAAGPRAVLKALVPYAALTTVYLAVDLWINSRNYVVAEGHYTIGWHVVSNALTYIDALYVGRRDTLSFAVITLGLGALLVRGNARVRFATCWMLLALAPFLSFTWGNTSRYLYQPAIGFSLLLAEAIVSLGRPFSRPYARVAFQTLLIAGIGVRFALFAHSNVRDFATRSQVYPEYLARFRETYGAIPPNTIVSLDPRLQTKMPYQFVNAAVQWEYKDRTIALTPYESQD